MRLNRSIERQLQRLEAQIVQQETVVDEKAEREAERHAVYQRRVDTYFAALDELASQLPEELFAQLIEEAQSEGYDQMMMGFFGASDAIQAPLLFAVCSIADHHNRQKEHEKKPVPPLAIPESLARWFVEHGHLATGQKPKFRFDGCGGHDCEDCGFVVPAANIGGYYQCRDLHAAGKLATPETPFLRCPVCGGATGWGGYWVKDSCAPGDTRRPYGELAAMDMMVETPFS